MPTGWTVLSLLLSALALGIASREPLRAAWKRIIPAWQRLQQQRHVAKEQDRQRAAANGAAEGLLIEFDYTRANAMALIHNRSRKSIVVEDYRAQILAFNADLQPHRVDLSSPRDVTPPSVRPTVLRRKLKPGETHDATFFVAELPAILEWNEVPLLHVRILVRVRGGRVFTSTPLAFTTHMFAGTQFIPPGAALLRLPTS